jgi:hypothetical protein
MYLGLSRRFTVRSSRAVGVHLSIRPVRRCSLDGRGYGRGWARRIERGKDKEGVFCAVCRSDEQRIVCELMESSRESTIAARRPLWPWGVARQQLLLGVTEKRSVSRYPVELRHVKVVPCEAARVEAFGRRRLSRRKEAPRRQSAKSGRHPWKWLCPTCRCSCRLECCAIRVSHVRLRLNAGLLMRRRS